MKEKQNTIKELPESLVLRRKIRELHRIVRQKEEVIHDLSNQNQMMASIINNGENGVKANGNGDKMVVHDPITYDKINQMELVGDALKMIAMNDKLSENEFMLKQINDSKDKFFTIIAHDLMNPLQSLLLSSEYITGNRHHDNIEQIKTECRDIYNTTKNLIELLQNLLQWARSQSGRIEINPEFVDINLVVEETIDLLAHSAKQKEITIINNIRKSSYPWADLKMITTIIRNLLSNAIKFTPTGGNVKISSKNLDNSVQITVNDTGMGIPPDLIKKLFRIEYRIATEGTSKEQGTGMGLILVKEFIEKNNGRIWIESEYGKGSSFIFTLPVNNRTK
jgi:signal transduction histidine kinase